MVHSLVHFEVPAQLSLHHQSVLKYMTGRIGMGMIACKYAYVAVGLNDAPPVVVAGVTVSSTVLPDAGTPA
jgi:hypothetical protein